MKGFLRKFVLEEGEMKFHEKADFMLVSFPVEEELRHLGGSG
jgi:hypothetical protein